jgi:hypothetical protein
MRYEYEREQKQVCWGYDQIFGFFIQVIDESDYEDKLLADCDYSLLLTGQRGGEPLTFEKAEHLLKDYPEAEKGFADLINTKLTETLIGYRYNEDGRYRDRIYMKTYLDLMEFYDSVYQTVKETNLDRKGPLFTITDTLDELIMQR